MLQEGDCVKFLDLKRPRVKKKRVGWSGEELKILCDNFYLIPHNDLRKMLGGRSISAIKNKASQLRKRGWIFSQLS